MEESPFLSERVPRETLRQATGEFSSGIDELKPGIIDWI